MLALFAALAVGTGVVPCALASADCPRPPCPPPMPGWQSRCEIEPNPLLVNAHGDCCPEFACDRLHCPSKCHANELFADAEDGHYYDCTRGANASACYKSWYPQAQTNEKCGCIVRDCLSSSEDLKPQNSTCVVACRDPNATGAKICDTLLHTDDQLACHYYAPFVCVAMDVRCDAAKLQPPPNKCEAGCLAHLPPLSSLPLSPAQRLEAFLNCLTTPPCRPGRALAKSTGGASDGPTTSSSRRSLGGTKSRRFVGGMSMGLPWMAASALSALPRRMRPFTTTRADALVAAAAVATSAAVPRASAALLHPATTWLLQDQLVSAHAERFATGSCRPAAVALVKYNGRTIRQLLASEDVEAGRRVAVYPVEVAFDEDEFDDMYAIRVYREVVEGGRLSRKALEGVSGILTDRALAHAYVGNLPTIAPFANEPDASHAPNCMLAFPTIRAGAQVRRGSVLFGYLETTSPVAAGAPLTWCYGPSDVERAYPTSCAATAR